METQFVEVIWCWNNATALAGYATLMMMMIGTEVNLTVKMKVLVFLAPPEQSFTIILRYQQQYTVWLQVC